MRPFAAVLLGALVAVAVTAAPAPVPRPWLTSWDRRVDPVGDCNFHRDGDRLTITVPGPGHQFDVREGQLNAPRVLRDVEGDFVVQVRVSGLPAPQGPKGRLLFRRAGLLLTDGKTFVKYARAAYVDAHLIQRSLWSEGHGCKGPGGCPAYHLGPPPEKAVYLCVERRAAVLRLKSSLDGKAWERATYPVESEFPRKLKVGVLAEATAAGEFKPVFDQFKLTRLKE